MELTKVDFAKSPKLSPLPHHRSHGSLFLEQNPAPIAVLHRKKNKSTKAFPCVNEYYRKEDYNLLNYCLTANLSTQKKSIKVRASHVLAGTPHSALYASMSIR